MVALVPKRHPLASKRQVTIRELAGESLISFEPDTPHGAVVSQMFASEKLNPRIEVVIRHIETAVGLVAHGVGIAIVDEFSVADRWSTPMSIVRVKNSPPLHVHLSWNEDVVRSQFFKRFEILLAKVLGNRVMP